MILPFWNSELYVEVSPSFPFGKDYHTASVNRFYSDTLKRIAQSCLSLDSEFFFMASPEIGCVGSLPRENFFKYTPDASFNLGFLLVLGYSEIIEKIVIASLGLTGAVKDINAGITSCAIWSRGIYKGRTKVITLASYEPFYNPDEYLNILAKMLEDMTGHLKLNDYAYYAERFGYDRFFVEWENDNPVDIWTSQMLSEFEYDQTKEIVGGASTQDFPPFLGSSVSIREIMPDE